MPRSDGFPSRAGFPVNGLPNARYSVSAGFSADLQHEPWEAVAAGVVSQQASAVSQHFSPSAQHLGATSQHALSSSQQAFPSSQHLGRDFAWQHAFCDWQQASCSMQQSVDFAVGANPKAAKARDPVAKAAATIFVNMINTPV
jgi:hypothetical protein